MVRRFPDLAALVEAAAAELATLVDQAVQARGTCHLALSGGSTPRPLYQRLATMPLPWDRVELWWGDERAVPPDHTDSNYRMAREAMLDAIAPAQVHRIAGELEPEAAAADYERELLERLGTPPVLDVALLGLGADGHTASLFPGSPAVRETTRWVVANRVAPDTTRITMTAPALCASRHVRFLVAGAEKEAAVAAVREGPRDPDRYPAQLVTGADVVWFVAEAT